MDKTVRDFAHDVFDIEIEALQQVKSKIDGNFDKACKIILEAKGRVIVCGMGKSGIIGKKIAASLASTGTPSFFMHPGEAYHGDLGMVTSQDVFVAISNSGETDELLKLIPFLDDNGNQVIAMCGNENSTLAIRAHCFLNIGVDREACPLQLAPTASTTAALAMGDALTISLMNSRGFRPENFARFHPGGSLGKKLLQSVQDLMVCTSLPLLKSTSSFDEVIQCITKGALGIAIVVSDSKEIEGVITDGDLRRAFKRYGGGCFTLDAQTISSKAPIIVAKSMKMEVAYEVMEKYGVTTLLVGERGKLVGVIKK